MAASDIMRKPSIVKNILNINRSTNIIILIILILITTLGIYRTFTPAHGQLQSISEFELQMKGTLDDDDPGLLEEVRQRFLHGPSSLEYHLIEDENSYLGNTYIMSKCCSWAWYDKIIKELFNESPPGFFVEAGAHDGEFFSNTLYLERRLGWTGLLVEVDREIYKKLQKKNRKSWSSNCCLATMPYPHQAILRSLSKSNKISVGKTAMGTILSTAKQEDTARLGFEVYQSARCIPLYTLLKAIEKDHVDLISLDVEGAEMGVLENIPWHKMTVDVWMVEHRSLNEHGDLVNKLDPKFISWFESMGYNLYAVQETYSDYVFIRNGTSVHKRAFTLQNGKLESKYVET
ncbi:unnamed protein product [Meganyctiphanes norvegica]|uniref:Methyltransferase FkbM domain-containing protein n=1 Tax=Meganyctiphanes norvegica TaxID=48144 RepID=A0AAV2QLF9_MEGNR